MEKGQVQAQSSADAVAEMGDAIRPYGFGKIKILK